MDQFVTVLFQLSYPQTLMKCVELFNVFQVQILDIQEEQIKDSDVLIMGTDGLWDVTSNEKAVEIVQRSLDHFPANDKSRLKYR
jgi:serine/threonine protein phosphatase PrpC